MRPSCYPARQSNQITTEAPLPFTINGIGTHYYGRRNDSVLHGTCPQCNREARLSSYDTTEFFCFIFVPLIPIRKYRIESECSACRRHYRIPLEQFNAVVSSNVEPLREAARRDPHDPQKRETLIRELISVNLTADAEAAARDAAIAFPQSEVLNSLAGDLAAARADLSSAEAWYRRAVAANARSWRAHIALGEMLTLLGRKDDAIRALQDGIAGESTPRALYVLATNQMELGQWSDAYMSLQRLGPIDDREVLRAVAECKNRLGYPLSDVERKAARRWWPRRKTKRRPVIAASSQTWNATPSTVNLKGFAIAGACIAIGAVVIGVGFGLWRQNHVRVYFDNALGRPLTMSVDGAKFPVEGRPPVLRELAPGRHRIIVTDSGRELERFEANIPKMSFYEALMIPRFFIYNTADAGIYLRSDMVYAANESDQKTESKVIALERWIEQDDADYVFTEPPSTLSLSSSSAVARKTALDVATDISFRDLAYSKYEEGGVEAVARVLRKGVELAPCDDGRRSDLVDLFAETGDRQHAAEESQAWVVACGDRSINAHRTYQNLRRSGDRKPLLAEYRERVTASPTAANHYLYGRLLDGEAALAEHSVAINIDPKFSWPRIAVGHQLLVQEQDAAAFDALTQALRINHVDSGAAIYYAMAAVGAGKQDEAAGRLSQLTDLDRQAVWQSKWILARSKEDLNTSRALLAELEKREGPGPRIEILRAWTRWYSGEPAEPIIEILKKSKDTLAAANAIAFEDALQRGMAGDAISIEKTALRGEGPPSLYSVYAVEAAMLTRSPEAPAMARALRTDLEKDAANEQFLLTLLDCAEGRMKEDQVAARLADLGGVTMIPHGWFALGVNASARGDRENAARLFRRAASRALDREFPYGLAMKMAETR